MQNKSYIQKAVSMIEKGLSDHLSAEQIAFDCYASPRQFYRDFYSLTGHSVHEYIRRRRLSKALSLIKYSDMRLVDIAYSCGYSSQAALCQTVKHFLDMTPMQYKVGHCDFYFPVFNTDFIQQIEVKPEIIPGTLSIRYTHRQLMGIESKAVDYFLSLAPHYNGRIFGRNSKPSGKQFCYELRVYGSHEIVEAVQNSDLYITAVNPPMQHVFARTSVKNHEPDINAAWDYLYGKWLKNSMFEQDDAPYFEEYIISDHKIKKLVLYMPVKPQQHVYQMSVEKCGERLFLVSTQRGKNAEKAAADVVTEFISGQYPYLFTMQKEYYTSKKGVACTCGMRIYENRYTPDDGSVTVLQIPEGLYAVLIGECYGDNSDYEEPLLQWINESGFEKEGDAFTLYDVSRGMGRNEIVVKSYIKLAEKQNTSRMEQGILKEYRSFPNRVGN